MNWLMRAAGVLIVVRPMLDPLRDQRLGPVAVTDLVGGMVVLAVSMLLLSGSIDVPRRRSPLSALCFFTFIFSVTSLLVALARGLAAPYDALVRLAFVLAVALFFWSLATRRPDAAWRLWIWMCAPSCVWGAWHTLTGGGQQPNPYAAVEEQVARSTGPFVHPSVLAGVAMILVLALAAVILHPSWGGRPASQRFRYWTLLAVAVVALYGTLSRVYLAATIISMVIILARGLSRVAFIYLGSVASGLFLLFAGERVLQRLSGSSSLDYRFQLWSAMVRNADAPAFLFGLGSGSMDEFVPRAAQTAGLFKVQEAHNDYLRLVLEAGIVGFLIYVLVAIRLWRQCSEKQVLPRIARATILAMATVSLTDNLFNVLVVQAVAWGILAQSLATEESRTDSEESDLARPADAQVLLSSRRN